MGIESMTVSQLCELAKVFCSENSAQPSPNGSALPKKGEAKATSGIEEKRVVLVVSSGWVFAGDQSLSSDGYIVLKNALHVFRWEGLGFSGVIETPLDKRVDLRPVADVEVPVDAVIFRVPVPSNWGHKAPKK